MTIKIHNDGKCKFQSWEARSELLNDWGYGETEEEAVEELRRLIDLRISELKETDFDSRIRVAWDGTPVDEYLRRRKTRS